MSGLKLWRELLHAQRRRLLPGLGGELGQAAVVLARPLCLGLLIDRLLHGGGLLWPLLALAAAWSLRLLLGSLRERVQADAGARLGTHLRSRVARQLHAIPWARAEALGGAALAGRLGEDVRQFSAAAIRIPVEGVSALLRIVVALILLAVLHPAFLLALLPFVPLLPILLRAGRRSLVPSARRAAHEQAGLDARWAEAVAGRALFRQPLLRRWMAGDLGGRAAVTGRAMAAQATAEAWWQPGVLLALTVGLALILVLGAPAVAAGGLSPGGLTAALFLVFLALGPVLELTALAGAALPALAAAGRLAGFLAEPAADPVAGAGTGLAATGLTFAHPGRPPLFTSVSLTLRPGDRLVVQGPSGSGKSTLVQLLSGLRPAEAVASAHAGAGGVIAVFQHERLITGSIREDLRLAQRAAGGAIDDDGAIAVARELGVHHLIEALPDGYRTRSVPPLPPAAMQAVAILRAVLSRPAALLLDEATSACEHGTARRIVEALAARPAALLVATHRDPPPWPRLRLA